MNYISPKRKTRITKAAKMGYSLREIAVYASVNRGTAQRYLRLNPWLWECACGKPLSAHRGMCPERFKRHPKRQKFMTEWPLRKEIRRLKALR